MTPRQTAFDLVSAIETMPEEMNEAQSFAVAAVVHALIYIGDGLSELLEEMQSR